MKNTQEKKMERMNISCDDVEELNSIYISIIDSGQKKKKKKEYKYNWLDHEYRNRPRLNRDH